MIYEKFENELREIKYPETKIGRKSSGEERNARTEQRREYNQKVTEVNEKFKIALFDEYGVKENPKAQKAFYLAWEHGHSSGYSEVEIYFGEFVELIK